VRALCVYSEQQIMQLFGAYIQTLLQVCVEAACFCRLNLQTASVIMH
jgi:hypothetical protein